MAEVAVIVPAYCPTEVHVNWLGECLGSVFAQTFTDWEVVVVVNGRTDMEFGEHDERLKILLFEEQQSPGFARNMGVRATSAPWILFLDADDKLKPEALERLYGARCESAAIYGDLDWIGDKQGHERLVDFSTKYLREFSGPQPITALHHRLAWQLVAGFMEHLEGLEDLEYWIRLAEQGICGQRIDATTLEYRQHGDSRQKQLETSGRIREVMADIRQRHASFFNGGHMGCSTCPNGQTMVNNPNTPPQPEGTVALRYLGRREGSFFMPPSPVTGQTYRIEGKGAFLYVPPNEVEHLMMFYEAGGPMFEIQKQEAPVAPVPVVVPAPRLFEKLTLAPAVEDITGLSIRQASPLINKQTSIPDLRVMLAMEKAASDRTTIKRLIEERIAELSGDNA